MLLSRSWIDSIILIGVCCPMFSSNDKRRKKRTHHYIAFVFNLSLEWTTPKKYDILHAEAFYRTFFQHEKWKITKWCTTEKNTTQYIIENSMIGNGDGAQMENWFDILWHKKKRRNSVMYLNRTQIYRIDSHQNGFRCIFLGFYFERIIESAFMRMQRTKIDKKNRSSKRQRESKKNG